MDDIFTKTKWSLRQWVNKVDYVKLDEAVVNHLKRVDRVF